MADGGDRVQVDFRTEPGRYKHWRLRVRGPGGHAGHGRARGRRSPARLRAEAQLLRPRRRRRAVRRRPAAALRAPRGRGRHPHLGQGARLLRRRQHPHAGPVLARLEGELLQVHQRDAQRAGGGLGRVGPDVDLRGQRPLRRRRLRAGAGLPAHRDGRRRQHLRRAAGGPAAGRAPGHRWPHPARRQAPGAPRPRRLLLHAGGGHQGQAGGRMEPRGRGRAALEAGGDGPPARRGPRPAQRPARRRAGRRAHPARADAERRPRRLSLGELRARPASRSRRDHRGRPHHAAARRPPPGPRPRARRSGHWRWPASWTT